MSKEGDLVDALISLYRALLPLSTFLQLIECAEILRSSSPPLDISLPNTVVFFL